MPTPDEVRAVIAEEAAFYGVEPEDVTDDARLEDLGLDSLDRVELLMALEEAFDVEISDEDAERIMDTVGHVVSFLAGPNADFMRRHRPES